MKTAIACHSHLLTELYMFHFQSKKNPSVPSYDYNPEKERAVIRASICTAVQDIWAKNIIDVMIEIPPYADMKDIAQILEQNSFTVMSSETNRISLNKGYTEAGFADKVFHIHLRYAADNDELYSHCLSLIILRFGSDFINYIFQVLSKIWVIFIL